jgi:hypothetical protein
MGLVGAVWSLVIRNPGPNDPDPFAREHGIGNYYTDRTGFRRDAIEQTPEFQAAAKALEPEIAEQVRKSGMTMGRLHLYDQLLKDLLWKRYSIRWRTLHEMNPEVIID